MDVPHIRLQTLTPNLTDTEIHHHLRDAEQRMRTLTSPPSTTNTNTTRRSEAMSDSSISLKATDATQGATLGVRTPKPRQKSQRSQKQDDAGSNWFSLPRTALTPEFKRDWQVLRMRGVLDPRHHKKALHNNAPEYSQVGEIIAGPADYYGAQLTKKEKKRTIFEEVMYSKDGTKLREKYQNIQRAKASGKKAYYKNVKARRKRR